MRKLTRAEVYELAWRVLDLPATRLRVHLAYLFQALTASTDADRMRLLALSGGLQLIELHEADGVR